MALLEVKDLHTSFFTDAGEVKAVNGVSFSLDRGKVLGIVGESGSGKSVTAYSIMQILASAGKIVSGSICMDGQELVGAGEKVMKDVRGNKISIIFQDPMTSLNPTYTIGRQLMEAILLHTDRNKQQAQERAIEMLRLVNINEPEKRMKQYPLFSHSYFRLVASARGMSASELLSSRLMFPTPLASDTNTNRDARNLDVFLSENGIFRKRNKSGSIWSLSLSAAVFYLTPAASEGYRSTLKPTAFRNISPGANLSTQIVQMEKPEADNMALNPDWVEWLMGFPLGWTDVSFGPESRKECPA